MRDYVLHGRYCDSEFIRAELAQLRERAGARAALLVAYRGSTLFHSLLLVSHRSAAQTTRLQRTFHELPSWPAHQRLPFDECPPGPEGDARLLTELREQPPFSKTTLLRSSALQVHHLRARRDEVHGSVGTPASIVVLLVDADEETSDFHAQLDTLMVMVNASAPVVVNGGLEVERIADRALEDGSETIDGDAPGELATLRSLSAELLRKATALTHSSFGNVYMADRDGKHLTLVAEELNEDPIPVLAMKDPRSVVSWVYRRGRPIVINDIRDFVRMRPMSRYRDATGTEAGAYAELAVPIVQHSFGDGASNVIGVVNVEKLDGDSGHFTYHDITVLRSIAGRLALWRAHTMLRHTSVSLAQLTRRNAGQFADPTPDPVPITDHRLPIDADSAHGVIADTLRRVFDLTRSQSVTVRLLSPCRQWLMRFASHPATAMDDDHAEIHIGKRDSVITWVARTGLPCHLRNVADLEELRRYRGLDKPLRARPDTVSELCLPIFVAGRLVGTLNLESCFRDGYVDSFEVALAVAEQVGLALQYARRVQEQAVFSMSTASTANVHELGKRADALRRLADDAATPSRLADELHGIGKGIADSMRSGADSPSHPRATTRDLVREVLAELHLAEAFTTRSDTGPEVVHSEADALALRVALTALLENAWNHAAGDAFDCSINWRTSTIGGQRYLTMLIGNNVELESSQLVLQNLFRKPICFPTGGRAHIGAFTAAALVRSLGGDVFVRSSGPGRFVVGVDLPVVDAGATTLQEDGP